MGSSGKPVILSVDDDAEILRLMERFLKKEGFDVMTAGSAAEAERAIGRSKPDMILLDVNMPDRDGYEFCAQLQENTETACIPVVFLTAVDENQGKSKALAVGAVDYLTKPVRKDLLVEKVRVHIKTQQRWEELARKPIAADRQTLTTHFLRFKEFLGEHTQVSAEMQPKLLGAKPLQLYSLAAELGITDRQMAKMAADFLKVPYLPVINPEAVQLAVLPTAFCRSNSVVAVNDATKKLAFVLSNPFVLDLMDVLRTHWDLDLAKVLITEPYNIESLLELHGVPSGGREADAGGVRVAGHAKETREDVSKSDIERHPVVYLGNNILYAAVAERASDIHIEPKENATVVRFRIDGDMRDMFSVERPMGVMLLARLKALGGLDIAEKRRPQDGSVEAAIGNRTFQLRIATTSTPYGESMIMRVLAASSKLRTLEDLGMSPEQVKTMLDFGSRTQGLVLVVGPTGSGKTTTIYGLLSQVDCKKRSPISVEDPVEYRIPFVNQQQVNEKAGITFDALLKSSVRQDPDILFIGEIRDAYSARVAIDFSSTGHLTLGTLHTTNATSAIFRLERLGVTRPQMAEAVLGIVAQRLMKKLCPYCKKVEPISKEEADMVSPFTDDVPAQVAHPVGCSQCNHVGYFGREGVFEILRLDPKMVDLVRSATPIPQIRAFVRDSGSPLMSQDAMEKVRRLLFPPKDVYEKVLIEEIAPKEAPPSKEGPAPTEVPPPKVGPPTEAVKAKILFVDDDPNDQILIKRMLKKAGYDVTSAEDGVSALLELGQARFDLILMDIGMPHIDGFKLVDILHQKGIDSPVIFLTGRTEPQDEITGLSLGALDYVRKPVQEESFLLRVKRAVEVGGKSRPT